ncbi:MAG: serine/threonine-protein kinase [Phaeospirillum sp.]|nr:serine/threonine-protein kinase [Phaeospirillum sp.]
MSGQDTAPPSLAGWLFRHKVIETDFSEIWLAEDVGLERVVAFKIFAPKADQSGVIPPFHVDEWRRRFIQEARLLARFDHPHIIPVVALTQLNDGRPCMAMQYMAASLLREIGADLFKPEEREALAVEYRPRAIAPVRARRILLEVLSALIAVHDRGIVHRDLKPRNILLAGGPGSRIKLGDFGMARMPDESQSPKAIWIGTRDYISPEQYANATLVTDRADIFSLGVIGIRMVTGYFPDQERLRAVAGLPEAFADLLRQALAYRPDQRPSAAEMATRLAAIRL